MPVQFFFFYVDTVLCTNTRGAFVMLLWCFCGAFIVLLKCFYLHVCILFDFSCTSCKLVSLYLLQAGISLPLAGRYLFIYCAICFPFIMAGQKLIRSSSTTSGLFITLWLMVSTYSPINPMKKSMIAPRNSIPTTSGAMPALKRSHQMSFMIR